MNANELCRCGSGLAFSDCCAPYLAGTPAPTAEALMRSRYTAFVLHDDHYLRLSWHTSTVPGQIDSAHGPQWLGLEIKKARGGANDATGEVEFVARYRDGSRVGVLHETSRFVREEGRWYYVDGTIHRSDASAKTGRNDPCPCGSGRKFKQCCGA